MQFLKSKLRLQKPADGISSLPTQDLDLIPNGSNTPVRGWGAIQLEVPCGWVKEEKSLQEASENKILRFCWLVNLEGRYHLVQGPPGCPSCFSPLPSHTQLMVFRCLIVFNHFYHLLSLLSSLLIIY